MLSPFFFDQSLILRRTVQQYSGGAAQLSNIPRRVTERSLQARQPSVSRILMERVEFQIDEVETVRSCATLKTAAPCFERLL